MEGVLRTWILTSISVIILAMLTGSIVWTIVIGMNIANDWQDSAIQSYSDAGLSMMVDFSNIENVDALNLYKLIEINRSIIIDYSIKNLDGSYVYDLDELLKRPIDRFKLSIEGDSSNGFIVEVNQVKTERVGVR